jgi:uncharacterized membrane protein
MKIVLIILFISGILFSNASHIPQWYLGAGKPTHPHWKVYGIIAIIIWILLLVLANTVL